MNDKEKILGASYRIFFNLLNFGVLCIQATSFWNLIWLGCAIERAHKMQIQCFFNVCLVFHTCGGMEGAPFIGQKIWLNFSLWVLIICIRHGKLN